MRKTEPWCTDTSVPDVRESAEKVKVIGNRTPVNLIPEDIEQVINHVAFFLFVPFQIYITDDRERLVLSESVVEPDLNLWVPGEAYHVALDLEQSEIGVHVTICNQGGVEYRAHVPKWYVWYLVQSQEDVLGVEMNFGVFFMVLYLSEGHLCEELPELALITIGQVVLVWLALPLVQHYWVILQERRELTKLRNLRKLATCRGILTFICTISFVLYLFIPTLCLFIPTLCLLVPTLCLLIHTLLLLDILNIDNWNANLLLFTIIIPS